MLPGSFAIIRCGMPFEAEVTSSLESLHIYIHQKMIIEATSAFCNGDSGSLRFFRGLQRLMLCSSSWRVQSMKAALEPPAASSLYVGQLARAFAARLVVAHSNRSHDLREAGAKRGLARDDLNAVRDYIEAHLASPISLEDLIGLTRLAWHISTDCLNVRPGRPPIICPSAPHRTGATPAGWNGYADSVNCDWKERDAIAEIMAGEGRRICKPFGTRELLTMGGGYIPMRLVWEVQKADPLRSCVGS